MRVRVRARRWMARVGARRRRLCARLNVDAEPHVRLRFSILKALRNVHEKRALASYCQPRRRKKTRTPRCSNVLGSAIPLGLAHTFPGPARRAPRFAGERSRSGPRAAMADPITGAPPPPSPPPTLSFGCGDDDQCVYFDVSDREILVSLLIFATMGGLLLLVFGCIRHKAPIFFGRRRLRNLVRVPPASKPAWVPVVRASHGSRRSFSLAPGVRVLRHRVRRSYPFSALLLSPPPHLPPPPHKNPPPAPRRTAPRPSLGPTARGATPFSVG